MAMKSNKPGDKFSAGKKGLGASKEKSAPKANVSATGKRPRGRPPGSGKKKTEADWGATSSQKTTQRLGQESPWARDFNEGSRPEQRRSFETGSTGRDFNEGSQRGQMDRPGRLGSNAGTATGDTRRPGGFQRPSERSERSSLLWSEEETDTATKREGFQGLGGASRGRFEEENEEFEEQNLNLGEMDSDEEEEGLSSGGRGDYRGRKKR